MGVAVCRGWDGNKEGVECAQVHEVVFVCVLFFQRGWCGKVCEVGVIKVGKVVLSMRCVWGVEIETEVEVGTETVMKVMKKREKRKREGKVSPQRTWTS